MGRPEVYEGPYPDCDGKMVSRYDDVLLCEDTEIKLSTGANFLASAGAQATVLFFVSDEIEGPCAELEVYLDGDKFGFATVLPHLTRFYLSAADKLK